MDETDVTLTATPDGDMRFGCWTGACMRTSPICVVDMTEARAAFLPPPPIVTTFYHVDALGSMRVITDMTVAVVERHDSGKTFGSATISGIACKLYHCNM